ncbi:uncharacterized protein LOC130049491 isoform X2 [Ostrea edulis]|uniref:uncharacterized protein LOC130049491 isoform X2 n=1 Tax=Ostrea edulis TaxID=37623 RepID=UPI0024AFF957|nr:uncharacterized protein LOC130049491 isoform X2 [Ostrea edulis]XP_056003212.1 uncharacterized protein LOC130049491 isoform X2 [Ostrea edulis]XP_056003213.1 uncharacterized protein LOC130049491 isoform X2 [Ostrea edulis]XP_056003214.1 uncharacterized protein LOC130049491 isoform X2 [Ostrea edulis]
MTSQRRMHWKCGGTLLALIIAIYCFVKYMHSPAIETYSGTVTTCDNLENIFRTEKTQIMDSDLQATPIFPETKTDKCIKTVKWKFLEYFSKAEENGFKHCIRKNAYPKRLLKYYFERLNRNITSKFFSFLKGKSDVVVVEIGGFTGQLLQKLVPITGAKTYAVLEPVPSFFDKLNTHIDMLNLNSIVKTYNFGLGKTYKEISVDIRGDGTSIFQTLPSKKTERIKIVNVVDFFVQPHHDVPTVGNYICRYCRLRGLLARTHEIEYEYPHIWEAWKRKKIN